MRLGILLACWLCSCLTYAAPLRVGLENHDYYPYYSAVEGKPLDGYCIALLHAFAKHAGLELELRPQPVNRLYRSMLVEQNIDLLFDRGLSHQPEVLMTLYDMAPTNRNAVIKTVKRKTGLERDDQLVDRAG